MSDKTYSIKANDFTFLFTEDEIKATDSIRKPNGDFNLIRNNKSVNAKLISASITGKNAIVEVEGENFEITIKDELDQMLEVMGFGIATTKHIKEIKAPMPGLVLEISVIDGQEVKEGERILILEAMKMENSIMIPADAIIKKILVKAGQAVDKGQVLIELD
ncbi:MAG: acetyl-CoA carboxylase biotin carboxyl carrier protein subunit [Bacteroidota bacterium]